MNPSALSDVINERLFLCRIKWLLLHNTLKRFSLYSFVVTKVVWSILSSFAIHYLRLVTMKISWPYFYFASSLKFICRSWGFRELFNRWKWILFVYLLLLFLNQRLFFTPSILQSQTFLTQTYVLILTIVRSWNAYFYFDGKRSNLASLWNLIVLFSFWCVFVKYLFAVKSPI